MSVLHRSQNFLWLRTKPYFKVMRNAFISDMEYRSSYYILILSNFITMFMEMAVFRQVYAHRDTAGGLHKDQALSYVLLGMLVRNGCMLWSMVSDSIDQIRDGSFRKFLLQPLHYPSYFHAQAVGPKFLTWTLSIIAIVVCKQFADFAPLLAPPTWLPFIVSVLLAYLLTWQMYLCLVYIAFWIEEAQFLSMAFNIGMSLFTGSLIPLSWFPAPIAKTLEFTPFPLLGSFPVRTGLSMIDPQTYQSQALTSIGWIIVFVAINSQLRKWAFNRFEAFGG